MYFVLILFVFLLIPKYPCDLFRFSSVIRVNIYGILIILFFNEFLIYFFQRLRWGLESAECQTGDTFN